MDENFHARVSNFPRGGRGGNCRKPGGRPRKQEKEEGNAEKRGKNEEKHDRDVATTAQ